jgi:hypothetical protein
MKEVGKWFTGLNQPSHRFRPLYLRCSSVPTICALVSQRIFNASLQGLRSRHIAARGAPKDQPQSDERSAGQCVSQGSWWTAARVV